MIELWFNFYQEPVFEIQLLKVTETKVMKASKWFLLTAKEPLID